MTEHQPDIPEHSGIGANAWQRYWLRSEIPLGTGFPLGSTVSWCSSDQEAHYRATGNTAYGPDDITYEINSRGYRSMEVDTTSMAPKVLFLGCSLTFGVGMPLHEMWVTQVAEHLKNHFGPELETHNFGAPGVGGDVLAMTAAQMLPILRPKMLVVLFPNLARRAVHMSYNHRATLQPNVRPPKIEHIHDAYLKLQSNAQDWFEFCRNFTLIDALATSLGIPWVWHCWEPLPRNYGLYVRTDNHIKSSVNWNNFPDRARDNMHPGKQFNKQLAADYIAQINQMIGAGP